MNSNRETHKLNDTPILSSSVVHPTQPLHRVAKGDSGASQHYISTTDQSCLHSQYTSNGPTVLLPNNHKFDTTQKGIISLSAQLSKTAQTAHVLPPLHTSLISLGHYQMIIAPSFWINTFLKFSKIGVVYSKVMETQWMVYGISH